MQQQTCFVFFYGYIIQKCSYRLTNILSPIFWQSHSSLCHLKICEEQHRKLKSCLQAKQPCISPSHMKMMISVVCMSTTLLQLSIRLSVTVTTSQMAKKPNQNLIQLTKSNQIHKHHHQDGVQTSPKTLNQLKNKEKNSVIYLGPL